MRSSPLCCPNYAVDGPNADVSFAVPAGLDAILVELVWTDAQLDLDLLAFAPDYGPSEEPPGLPAGHHWLASSGSPGRPSRDTSPSSAKLPYAFSPRSPSNR